ncbi:hypothetical protein DES53_115160 [Roseimicrobium gellanilyticum]|uniref:Uncharacterized protein n=1 Tax=Roseimicrobium gellanilyticum TaxID=748857 RepID=A0A366H532_9BACT|nr:hypothetical protein DES53_115160 [Roseimicrobium gellanilyticum]
MTPFVSLSFNECCVDQSTSDIGKGHELGVASSARLSHGLGGSPTGRVGGALMHQDVCSIHQAHPTTNSARKDLHDFGPKTFLGPTAVPAVDGGVRPETLWQVTPRPCIAQAVEQRVQ